MCKIKLINCDGITLFYENIQQYLIIGYCIITITATNCIAVTIVEWIEGDEVCTIP